MHLGTKTIGIGLAGDLGQLEAVTVEFVSILADIYDHYHNLIMPLASSFLVENNSF